jgi:hypothetical protein
MPPATRPNVSGLVLYGLSLMSRRRDRHGLGVVLALGGSSMVAAAVSYRNPGFDAASAVVDVAQA